MILSSSVVEQFAVNELVVGSSPTSGAKANASLTRGFCFSYVASGLERRWFGEAKRRRRSRWPISGAIELMFKLRLSGIFCYSIRMLETKNRTLLQYFLPSFSEFEFIFIASLLSSLILLGMALNIGFLYHAGATLGWLWALGSALIVALILGSLVQMAVAAYRRPILISNPQTRMRYVLLPAALMTLIGIVEIFSRYVFNETSFDVVTPVLVILLVRYWVVAVLISITRYSDGLVTMVSAIFENYQVDQQDAIFAVTLAIICTILISFTKDWLLWIIIMSSAGQSMIRWRRNIRLRN